MPSVNLRQLRDTKRLKSWLRAGKIVELRERGPSHRAYRSGESGRKAKEVAGFRGPRQRNIGRPRSPECRPRGPGSLLSVYADSSFVVSLYLTDVHSTEPRLAAACRAHCPVTLTSLHRAEWAHALGQHQFRGTMTSWKRPGARIQEFVSDEAAGLWRQAIAAKKTPSSSAPTSPAVTGRNSAREHWTACMLPARWNSKRNDSGPSSERQAKPGERLPVSRPS